MRVLILGVNPFEDLPGYQLLSLLRSSGKYDIVAADDSIPARTILTLIGARIEALPHPSTDPHGFTSLVARLCDELQVDVVLPGTDAHLYALVACLSDEPQLSLLCPALDWLASRRLLNKWDLQRWASRFATTPSRWTFDDENDATLFAAQGMYPLMIKGLRKGAIKADDELEAVVARRVILRNPANHGCGGGAYAESFVDGEEHSLLVLTGGAGQIDTFGFLKLAATQLGTTLAAQVDRELPSGLDLSALLSDLTTPAVLELEWRKDATGRQWLFEVNVRFPSWIGAIGDYGLHILETYVNRICHEPTPTSRPTAPPDGWIFYRLPQSGFLPLEAAFRAERHGPDATAVVGSYAPRTPLLWRSTSPHQFRVK